MATTDGTAFAPIVASTEGTGNAVEQDLSRQSTRRSARASQEQNEGFLRKISRTLSEPFQSRARGRAVDSEDEQDEPISKADDWKLMPELKGYHDQDVTDNIKHRKLGVAWKDLTIRGVGADAVFNENVGSQFNIPKLIGEARSGAPLKTILDKSHGCVRPGEMLLVLGRPGAGCTTLLKALSNRRNGYHSIDGSIMFGDMDHKQAVQYRGQIVMNTEEELFFPTLTVGQTIDFATRMKVPFHLPSTIEKPEDYQRQGRDFLLRSMGIAHTEDTKVGDAFIRGVSGGERKRVSIIETMATRGSIFCWDNSTRGLDASTALEYTRAVRALTDILGLTSIVTLYQAGNGIYNLFDKVLVLEQGQQIYYGPMKEARPFMESLGFECSDAANVGDFLTGVVVPTERKIRPGFEDRFPRTALEFRAAYEATPIKTIMEKEYDYPTTDEARQFSDDFREGVTWEKHKNLPKSSQLTVSFGTQVSACVKRQYQILLGDKASIMIKQGSSVAQALITGSLFYDAPNNSAGLFIKGGALFFSLLFNSLVAMSEVTDSFSGRPILAKHRGFALYHPAAFCIAQIAADIPILFVQISAFSLVLYFMVGLTTSAGAFFTYFAIVFAAAMTMTAFFRAIGAAFSTFDGASKVSGFAVGAVIMYSGYLIPKPSMHPWFVWIYWINPMAYGLNALLSNELGGKILPCVGTNLIPQGPSYSDSTFQSCSGVPGSKRGNTLIDGDDYLAALGYSASDIWRNFGIIICFWVLLVTITIVSTSHWKEVSSGGGSLMLPRELQKKVLHLLNRTGDIESQTSTKSQEAGVPVQKSEKSEEVPSNASSTVNTNTDIVKREASSSSGDSATVGHDDTPNLVRNTSIFTWKDLTYTVQTPSGPRVLLDNVQGWIKPGMLGALMGSSGAGKTTLLDVLAQRKTEGTIRGSVLVDGRELTVSFQRSAGYCEQLDVHESLTTVREALVFSALLRQSRDTPREEKLAYVETIIDLLELQDIENSLVGKVGAGLSVEQRKRLTIGVELVSKPSILIFLDEPTSGLDGQAAFNTVRFLKKLAAAGQAVLCTIHQPSAQLFAEFDTLLLLAKGGKTVYFGEIGDEASTIKEYFKRYDAPCPDATNPAEHMIDVVSGSLSQGRDWNDVWLKSPECKHTIEELDRMVSDAAAKPPGTVDDGFEFATSLWEQTKLVTRRMNISLWRNTDYINNKFLLHVGTALFNGFTFWMIGDSVADLQQRLFTIFNFIFVAPGVIAQLQPLFIERRDIFEVREKKSKMYSWVAFTTALIVSEIPYLCICAVFYFVCWYYTVGFPSDSGRAGGVFFVMLVYEFVYTGLGQFVAAYAPNAVFAALANPIILGTLVSFAGVLVPYNQIQVFWRYWLYYLNPFTFIMGSLLVFTTNDVPVNCTDTEFAVFDTPGGQTCASYLADYLAGPGSGTNLVNPDATSGCKVCVYRTGTDYLVTVNRPDYFMGWRDAGIVALFAFGFYGLVFLFMKLRTKQSKKAE